MKSARYYFTEVTKNTNSFYELSEEEKNGLKSVLLEIYTDIVTFCDKHNIKVMMGGGSALGTVRHGGFIPWDDDLDINMPREDYDRFFSLFPKEMGEKYIISVPRHGKSKCTFGKVIKRGTLLSEDNYREPDETDGIYIDVFPLERMPDNKFFRTIKGRFLDFLRVGTTSVDYFYDRKFLLKNVSDFGSFVFFYGRVTIGLFFSIFGRQNLIDLYDKVAASSSGDKYWSFPTGRKRALGEVQKKEVFFPLVESNFAGVKAYLPHDVDSYLSNLYGNYMEIPSVEKRERHFVVKFSLKA